MGSIRTLRSVCRHCGNRLLRGEIHRTRDGARVCLSCAGNETFGRESWQAYLSWKAEVDRLVDLIEQWDREDVHDLLAWLTELVALLEDTGEYWSDYVDLPDLPQDLRAVVTAVDRHGRCLINGRVLSSLDDYEPDETEVSRLVGLIEQWDHEDVRDLQDWLLDLQGILSPSGDCVREYVSLPSVDVPEGIEKSIIAIDKRGRCLMDDYRKVSTLIRLRYPDN